MKMCLIVPSLLGETGEAALAVADFAVGEGLAVHLIVRSGRGADLYPRWGARAAKATPASVTAALSKASAVVFVGHDRGLHDAAMLAAPAAVRVLVPTWQDVDEVSEAVLRGYATLVCPSQACRDAVLTRGWAGDDPDRRRVLWSRWPVLVDPVRRDGLVGGPGQTVCLWLGGAGANVAALAATVAADALAGHKRLTITLAGPGSVKVRAERAALARAQATARLWLQPRVATVVQRAALFHRHDWVAVVAPRSDFAVGAEAALAVGAGVLAHDVPPWSGLAAVQRVACDIRVSPHGVPTARPTEAAWLAALDAVAADPRQAYALQQQDWGLGGAKVQFRKVWRQALGV